MIAVKLPNTIKILKFRIPEKIGVIILKLGQYRFTTE